MIYPRVAVPVRWGGQDKGFMSTEESWDTALQPEKKAFAKKNGFEVCFEQDRENSMKPAEVSGFP